MPNLIHFLRFLSVAITAYRAAKAHNGLAYCALNRHDIPCIVVLVGLDREAWRVSEIATDASCRDSRQWVRTA